MKPTFKFQPISFSWVAIHPNPKGVIQFIGGAFFGSFPTLSYQYFLRKLFESGYTIVALPFRFSFRHWSIAISLLQEQAVLAEKIPEVIQKLNQTGLNYQADIYQDRTKYYWVGHSLGAKYIALLEFLSSEYWKEILKGCALESEKQIQWIEDSIEYIPLERRSIKGQPSLLIAPYIGDTQSAIPKPLDFLAHFLDRIKLGVLPTRKQTQCFIEKSDLFNLTALISFDKDKIAGSKKDKDKRKSDVLWMIDQLQHRAKTILHEELPSKLPGRHCKHLEPIGIQIGNYIFDINPFDKFIEPLKFRQLEYFAIQFLDKLKTRK